MLQLHNTGWTVQEVENARTVVDLLSEEQVDRAHRSECIYSDSILDHPIGAGMVQRLSNLEE